MFSQLGANATVLLVDGIRLHSVLLVATDEDDKLMRLPLVMVELGVVR